MLSFITKGYFRGLTPAQQQPFFAVAGNAAVFTHSSGDLKADFAARNKLQNHFPHIEQNKNVAILLYRPNRDLLAFRRGGLPVSLHWPDYMVDEHIEVDNWKIGPVCKIMLPCGRHGVKINQMDLLFARVTSRFGHQWLEPRKLMDLSKTSAKLCPLQLPLFMEVVASEQ